MSHSINMASYVEKITLDSVPHVTPQKKLQKAERPKCLRECFYNMEIGRNLFFKIWKSEIKKEMSNFKTSEKIKRQITKD